MTDVVLCYLAHIFLQVHWRIRWVTLFSGNRPGGGFLCYRTLEQSPLSAIVSCICFDDASGTVDMAKSCAEVMFVEEQSPGRVSRALCWKCHSYWQKAFYFWKKSHQESFCQQSVMTARLCPPACCVEVLKEQQVSGLFLLRTPDLLL